MPKKSKGGGRQRDEWLSQNMARINRERAEQEAAAAAEEQEAAAAAAEVQAAAEASDSGLTAADAEPAAQQDGSGDASPDSRDDHAAEPQEPEATPKPAAEPAPTAEPEPAPKADKVQEPEAVQADARVSAQAPKQRKRSWRRIDKDINFLGNRKILFAISGVLVAISLLGILVRGLSFGIEFTGGTSISFNDTGSLSIAEMRKAFEDAGDTDAVIQTQTSGGTSGFLVRTTQTDPDAAAAEAQKVAEDLSLSLDSYQVTTIGPDWGGDITQSSITAFLVSILAIIIYIAFRFELKMGVMSVVALFHDLIIVIGIYALVGREVTPNVVAALLTILGYSLYDTVVVFHRINDNAEQGQIKGSLMKLANHSINQVFIRTINTTLTSLIPVVIMLFFGGETLKDFAFAMVIGLICGSYSSIAIATPLYTLWKQREPKYARLAKRYPHDMLSTRERKQLEAEQAAQASE